MIGSFSMWWYRHRRITRPLDTLAGWIGLGVLCAITAAVALSPFWILLLVLWS